MKIPPYLRTIPATMEKYSRGGVTKPPTPWIGSAMKAASAPLLAVRIISSMSRAQIRSQSG